MIDTLFNKLGGLLEKQFLFASFLPTLFLVAGNLFVVGCALGLEGVAIWFSSLDATSQGLLAAMIVILTYVLAYVLSSLRGYVLGFWSCRYFHIPLISRKLIKLYQQEYQTVRDEGLTDQPWANEDENLADTVAPYWRPNGRQLDAAGQKICSKVAELVEHTDSPETFQQLLKSDIVSLYREYSGEDLTEFYHRLRMAIEKRKEEASLEIKRKRIQLDLNFGSYGTIQPTRLGNIVEAYNQYAYKRYNMEGEIFWPRLTHVTPERFQGQIKDKKAFFDFSLAMATVSALTGLAVLFYGPYVLPRFDLWFVWPSISSVLLLIAVSFYTTAVAAARDFGNILRAACDLFRLDLMKALGRPNPIDLATERAQWEELSQLSAYGTIENFPLRTG